MRKTIVIGGEKGGTGKTTIASNLALMSVIQGYDTLIIDADKQRSLSKWTQRRNETKKNPHVPCVHLGGKTMNTEIENLSGRYEVVIIDAGGRDSVELRASITSPCVSAFYSPLEASTFDLDTLDSLNQIVEIAQTYNQALKAHIIFNKCSTHHRSKVTNEAYNFIQKSYSDNFFICDTKICNRVAYKESTSYQQIVFEYEKEQKQRMPTYQANNYKSKASFEMISLYEEIFKEKFNGVSEL
jgi:chromosome partitioning protein